jgi:hypothetical protein
MSTSRAILVGHLVVNGPVLLLIAAGAMVGGQLAGRVGIGVVFGAAAAWGWWSLAVPRWRAWALARGVDADELQRLGVRTGLVWPKGWIPEKTELPPRDRR